MIPGIQDSGYYICKVATTRIATIECQFQYSLDKRKILQYVQHVSKNTVKIFLFGIVTISEIWHTSSNPLHTLDLITNLTKMKVKEKRSISFQLLPGNTLKSQGHQLSSRIWHLIALCYKLGSSESLIQFHYNYSYTIFQCGNKLPKIITQTNWRKTNNCKCYHQLVIFASNL